jgi:5-methylcytosine-specific restriction endonuclease McrA
VSPYKDPEYQKKYHLAHREELNRRAAEYAKGHVDERREYLAKWRAANQDKIVAYRESHRPAPKPRRAQTAAEKEAARVRHLASANAWKEKNRGRTADYWQQWIAENKQARVEYRKANPDIGRRVRANRRARMMGALVLPITQKMLDGKLEYWGSMCWVCRAAPFEHWDHVKPLAKGGAHVLSNLRPACHRCNSKKNATWPFKVAL